MDKYTLLNKILKESFEENASDYDDFDSYKKGVSSSGQFFVYSQIQKGALDKVKQFGSSSWADFADGNHMFYGRGIYTTMRYDDCIRYNEGDLMIKYAVRKDAFENFLILDAGVKEYLLKHGMLSRRIRLSTKLKYLLKPEDLKMVDDQFGGYNGNGEGLKKLDDKVESYHNDSSSWGLEERLLNILKSGEGKKSYRSGMQYDEEKRLDLSNVDGWAYKASSYGMVAIFRTTDLLIPVAYALRQGGRYGNFDPDESHMTPIFDNEDQFKSSNFAIDAYRRFRRGYPDTQFTEKTVCGYSLVKRGNKYNLVSARTGKPFSPLDFDACERFNPLNNTATFDIRDGEDGMIRFKVTSDNYGETIYIAYQQMNNDNVVEDDGEISYDDFVDVMNSFKAQREQNALNESVDEVFTHKTRDEFYDAYKNGKYGIHLYRATNSEATMKSMLNGISNDFAGTGGDSSMYYGFGTYWVRNPQSILHEKYGKFVVDCVLKDGYRNFLIFDDDIRAKYDPQHKTVWDQIQALVPQNVIDEINKNMANPSFVYHGDSLARTATQGLNKNGLKWFKDYGGNPNTIDAYRMSNNKIGRFVNTAKFAKAFFEAIKGKPIDNPLGARICDEILLSKTKIRGYVFTGLQDNNVVVVRDPNSLMPVGFSTDGGRNFTSVEHSEEVFDRINQNVNPYFAYRGGYNKINMLEKPHCGFSLVTGGNGSNYKDIWFHKPLLPIDVDNATAFSEMDNTATFQLAEVDFKITKGNTSDDGKDRTKDEYYLFYRGESGYEPVSFDEFMSFVDEGLKGGDIESNKRMHKDCILNSTNCV